MEAKINRHNSSAVELILADTNIVTAIIKAIRDGNWGLLSKARENLPSIDEFICELLDHMFVEALSRGDNASIDIANKRFLEYTKWSCSSEEFPREFE